MNRPEYDILKYNFENMLKKEQTTENKAFNEAIFFALSTIRDVYKESQEKGIPDIKKIDDSSFLTNGQEVYISNSWGSASETHYICKWLMYTFNICYRSRNNINLLNGDDSKKIPDDVVQATKIFIRRRENMRY